MTTTYITSDTAGAPTLNGAAGSLITLLDYLLVTTLGWTKSFSGTNLATYRAPTGNRFYLGVNDTTTLNARVRVFETATAAGVAVESGTSPMPTDALLSGGGYVYKGSDTSTTSPWRFASDGKMFHLSIKAAGYYALFSFGDFASYKTSDAFNTLLSSEGSLSSYANGVTAGISATASAQAGSFIMRPHTQIGGCVGSSKIVDGTYGNVSTIGGAGSSYPSEVEGALLLGRVRINESDTLIRGTIPGLWAPAHAKPLADGDTFSGTGDLSGREFVAWNVSYSGQVMIEKSDTWST